MNLPEYIIGDAGAGSEQEYVVRLHAPRFVARIQPADEPHGLDWIWIAEHIELLSVVEWLDDRPDDPSPLLQAAAVHAEMATIDAYDQEQGDI